METQVFWDIFSTPEQMNSEKWMIKGCTGMRKHLEQGKEYDQHRKLELNPPEKKRMKNDKLEAPLISSWESPDKNIGGKEWRDFPSIKGYLIKKSESLKKKGGRVGKNKDNLGWTKQTPLRKLGNDLEDVEMIGSTWREARRLEKNLTWRPRDQKGLVST